MEQLEFFDKIENKSYTMKNIANDLSFSLKKPGWPDDFGKSLKSFVNKNNLNKIKTLSLFSGAGGLDIGFNDCGFDVVASVEIEPSFCTTLEMNSHEFGQHAVNCIDIKEFNTDNYKDIEFIIGGPPCQTFSAAGRRANGVSGTTDDRGNLFLEYVRILKELTPKGFLFENVTGIISSRGGEDWKLIIKSFEEIGYKLHFRILDAADYGVPQHRERLIIVGIKDGAYKFPRPTHGPDSIDNQSFYRAGDAIIDLKILKDEPNLKVKGKYAYLLEDIPPGMNYSFYTEKMGHPKPIFAWRSKFSDFLYKADPMRPVRTIKASGGAFTGPLHWESRFFAISELKRLQTFPDDYILYGTYKIKSKQIGNSVPPQLARILAISIRDQLFKKNKSFDFKLNYLEQNEILNFTKRKREMNKIYAEKAKEAIKLINSKELIKPDSKIKYVTLNDKFQIIEKEKKQADYIVKIKWEDILYIEVHETHKNELNLEFEISNNINDWNIGINKVNFKLYSKNQNAFTLSWKIFEKELFINGLKSDIVQLNGYYQYKPNINCNIIYDNNLEYGQIVDGLFKSDINGKLVSERELYSIWENIDLKLSEITEMLKSLGYEIRNHNTNTQIEEGYWLIPYKFPTLSLLSVQYSKKL